MKRQINKLNQGFTIIEVLIVLAIAGLILAIVFLAVPALQRNSRNTAIRSDAASALAAVNDYIANNQGALPTLPTAAQTGPLICFGAAATGTPPACPAGTSEAKVRGGTIVQLSVGGTGMPSDTGTIYVRTGVKCNGNAFAASPRAVAAGFVIESSSSQNTAQCIES